MVYEYSRPVFPKKFRVFKRRKRIYLPKTKKAIFRSTQNFFRLVHHNVCTHPDLPVMMTLTTFDGLSLDDGYLAMSAFFGRLKRYYDKKNKVGASISYIAVPEWQKLSGNLHYHALVWGLCPKDIRSERSSRLFQRMWRRGYLDVRSSTYKSPKLSGYLAKYFSKSQSDGRTIGRRSYSASRNIDRPREVGSNSISEYVESIVDNSQLTKEFEYDTMWLGKCKLSIYIK